MKKLLSNNWLIILLLAFSGLIVWPLFMSGYFSHHDDLQVMRIFEMRKCLIGFQIPCRWVPDMGYGNGYPLFNFYGVFPYYLGAILSFVLGYVGAAKALFFIPLVAGAVGMYLLAKDLFGKVPGFLAAVLYLFAPYRALDSYVRGAIAELFAMTAVPFLLFFILRLIKEGKKKYLILTSLFLSIFLLSHNIMTLIFMPVIAVLAFYFLHANKWKNWKGVFMAAILGVGLSAFFVVPAFFEKNLVQTEALTRAELDFRAQFVKVGQIFFDRSWSYAGSAPLAETTISYQIGWPQWWLVALSIISLIFVKKKGKVLPGILLVIFAASTFMMHNKSAPIWELIEILVFVQFPWRFLSVVIFVSSLLGAYFASNINSKKYLTLLVFGILLSTILFNWKYFRPEHFYSDATDSKKLSGQSFVDQQKGSLLDYLPKTALEPRELAPTDPIVISGEALISNYVNKSNKWSFETRNVTETVVNVPVFDFPNWVVYIDGNIVQHSLSQPSGRIEIAIPTGSHRVYGVFKNTPIRTVANLISTISLLGILFVAIYGKNSKIYR